MKSTYPGALEEENLTYHLLEHASADSRREFLNLFLQG